MNDLQIERRPRPTAIDLFCGAGGLTMGFRGAGFDILAANDLNEYAAATYRLNNPNTRVFSGAIEAITGEQLLCGTDLSYGQLDVLLGGPPCQAFSVYNHQRGMHDERAGLFRDYLRLVNGLRPKVVIIENVTGMTSVDDGRAFKEIKRGLSRLGYRVESRILRAEEYGVPQERRRLFFIGSRDTRRIEWPEPSHGASRNESDTLGSLKPLVTVSDAIEDLPPLNNGEGSDETAYPSGPFSEYQRLLRQGSAQVLNHTAPHLTTINLERIAHIPQGGNWCNLPYSLLTRGMRRARRTDHTKRYGRLHSCRQASTILTKCDIHWGAYIHPKQDRTITVREAARLQSFPDSFRFLGSRGDQYKQVGNAVPPLLAEAVAHAVMSMIRP